MPEKTPELFQKDGAGAQGRVSREMMARIGISVLLFLTAVCSYRFGISHALPFGFVICRLSAVTGLWLFVSGKWLPPVRDFMNHNFFLYATHFAVVRFLNKAGAKVLHITPVVPLVLFLIMPVLALIICTLAGRALRFVSPKLWKLLNGNR